MTLVETTVAFAIISVILVVAVMGVNTIAGVNARSQGANMAYENIEYLISQNTGGEDSESVALTISNGEEDFVIEGVFRTFTVEGDGTGSRSITVFVSGAP